jgi:hypothetical protein
LQLNLNLGSIIVVLSTCFSSKIICRAPVQAFSSYISQVVHLSYFINIGNDNLSLDFNSYRLNSTYDELSRVYTRFKP